MIKLLIGGSPCTFWSIAQKNNRETEAEGAGWELFKNFLIARDKFKPDLFLYENNKSAAQPIKDQISRELGVDLMYINSALVSAQNRQRFYAFNWTVEQPEDRGILLRDILESGIAHKEKAYCLRASYGEKCGNRNLAENMKGNGFGYQGVVEPVGVGYRNRREEDGQLYRRFETHGEAKANALTSVQTDSMVAEPIQTDPTGKSRPIQASYGKYAASDSFKQTNPRTGVAVPIRIGTIESAVKAQAHDSQQYRVYSPDGKAVAICGNGGGIGAKTGLYATPAYAEWIDGKKYPIYEVLGGLITIKEKQYPIRLADGYYIIRKLTPTECERLQTMPDGYTAAVSNTQRYKGLGNGWTAEVIIHILRGALGNVPCDEEIVVLSMYDGIGTGRYCLDKMGFTNVTYYAYEIDEPAKKVALSNYADIIQLGDAYDLRKTDWRLPLRARSRIATKPMTALALTATPALPPPTTDEIFTIKARRCKRCGGLLTSKQAVEDGYGHVCKMKTQQEENARKPIDGQMTLLDIAETFAESEAVAR